MTNVNGTLPPVFMFGYERSGTTLLSMMAGAHPELAVPLSVTGMWHRYGSNMDTYNGLATHQDLERLVRDIIEEERILLWDEDIAFAQVMKALRGDSFPDVLAAFHQVYADQKNKPFWANLDIATLDQLPLVYSWFPDARFVHIVRDGRDVALSHETMPMGAANTFDCAQSWERRVSTSILMGKMLPENRYRLIRYEDLILKPEETLAGLCDFIGLDYSPEMLEYTTMVSGKIPESSRWLWPALDQKPQKKKCYAWKTRMDKKRRVVFEGEAGELLKQLGYETYTRIPKLASAYAYELWCFLGRRGRMRRFLRALGIEKESKLKVEWHKRND